MITEEIIVKWRKILKDWQDEQALFIQEVEHATANEETVPQEAYQAIEWFEGFYAAILAVAGRELLSKITK